jgi:hypothetical protein
MKRIFTLGSALCVISLANCAAISSLLPSPDKTEMATTANEVIKVDIHSKVKGVSPGDGATEVATISEIKLFFRDTTDTVKTIPGVSICRVTDQGGDTASCDTKWHRGAFCLTPKTGRFNSASIYTVVIGNLGCGDKQYAGVIISQFKTKFSEN